jgi:hypothetical protein
VATSLPKTAGAVIKTRRAGRGGFGEAALPEAVVPAGRPYPRPRSRHQSVASVRMETGQWSDPGMSAWMRGSDQAPARLSEARK